MNYQMKFAWEREGLTDVSPVCWPGEKITMAEFCAVSAAISRMKSRKSTGPSGAVAHMMKAADEVGMKWIIGSIILFSIYF